MRLRLLVLASLLALLVATFAAAPASAADCGPGVFYTVVRGDTLFRIALRYGTTMQAIASANGIANYNRIYYGTRLAIPCAGGASFPTNAPYFPPPAFAPPVYVPPSSDSNGILPPVYSNPSYYIPPIYVDCTKLRPTAPRDGLNFGYETFYWDPVPGATGYRVNVYSVDASPGRLVGTWDVPATLTRLTGDLGYAAGPGFRFQWEVQALVSDIVICQSARLTLWREAPPA